MIIKGYQFGFIVVLLFIMFIAMFPFKNSQKIIEKSYYKYVDKKQEPNPLDGCTYVYLDMGSNVGVQLRKLFEPQYYPNAPLIAIFDKYFGTFESRNPSEVCVVGFEPNIRHAENLTKIEESYNKCGWKTIVHTVTGVDVKPGKAEFAIASGYYNNIASHLIKDKEDHPPPVEETYEVDIVRIADYVNKVVGTRKIPNGKKGAVVIKLDVEGPEGVIIFDMMYSGALQHVTQIHWDNLHADDTLNKMFHEFMEKLNEIFKYEKLDTKLEHTTDIDFIDDESYGEVPIFDEERPLPVC